MLMPTLTTNKIIIIENTSNEDFFSDIFNFQINKKGVIYIGIPDDAVS